MGIVKLTHEVKVPSRERMEFIRPRSFGLHRFLSRLAIVICALIVPQQASPYGKAQTHLEVTEAILGGFGGDDFRELFDATSGAVDAMADEFEKAFPEMKKGFNAWSHRLMGHGWALDEQVPEAVLKTLETDYGITRKQAQKFCEMYKDKIIKKVIQLTGLPEGKATAFASLIIDLHLLEDLEPGNTAVKHVARIEKIIQNINRHLEVLLADDPRWVPGVKKALLNTLEQLVKNGATEKEAAKMVLDTLTTLRIGDRIHICYKDRLKLSWDPNRIVMANEKAAKARAALAAKEAAKEAAAKANKAATVGEFKKTLSSSAKYTTVATKTGEEVTAKTVENTAKKAGYKNTKMVRGLLQKVTTKQGGESFILSVPVAGSAAIEGVSAGVLTFVISEGFTAVGFAKGEMTEDAFWVETWKNAGAAVVDGVAVAVVCCLGFGPAGVVAIAVGVGAYIIYEVVFNVLYDINKFKGITLDDYLGVMPTEIQRRPSTFDYEGSCKILNYEGTAPGLGYEGNAPGLDYKGDRPGLGEVPNIRKDGFGL